METLDSALEADFSFWSDFLEYDKELLSNDVDIIDLIERHKKNHETQPSNE